MHLIAENLVPRRVAQFGLFEPPGERADSVPNREINARYGRIVLRSAATLLLIGVYCDTSNGYDIFHVHGKIMHFKLDLLASSKITPTLDLVSCPSDQNDS